MKDAIEEAFVLHDRAKLDPSCALFTAFGNTTALRPRKREELIDKLGELLCFERSGVRLYQALIDKTEASAAKASLPFTADDLRRLRDEELEHMHIAATALESVGADALAQMPWADAAAVGGGGVMQVMTDPRKSMQECLEAMLGAELLDTAGWKLLIRRAQEAGQDALVASFERALKRENEHVSRVKAWLETMPLNERR